MNEDSKTSVQPEKRLNGNELLKIFNDTIKKEIKVDINYNSKQIEETISSISALIMFNANLNLT